MFVDLESLRASYLTAIGVARIEQEAYNVRMMRPAMMRRAMIEADIDWRAPQERRLMQEEDL